MSVDVHLVDRLWPDPAAGISLDEALAGFRPPVADGRPSVAVNMVTSIDGRAQLAGTAEGLGSRTDRRLMRLYRAGFDAVGSGVGTLRATGVWLRVGTQLADSRVARGLPPQPVGVLLAGSEPVPIEGDWFRGDEPRILVVGADSPVTDVPAGTELLRAPDELPAPDWVLDRLGERGIGSFLLEGGPTINAAFLAAGLIDELYWTVGSHLLGTDALPMIEAVADGAQAPERPIECRLVSVLRHGDELFLRYTVAAER